MRKFLSLLGLFTFPSVAAAQSPFAGVWCIEYPVSMQIIDGVATAITGTGHVTFAVRGDSLIGQLVTDPVEGEVPPLPLRLAGLVGRASTVLGSRRDGAINLHGEERPILVVSTWRLTAQRDSLTGTVERRVEGFDVPDQGAQPVKGARQRP